MQTYYVWRTSNDGPAKVIGDAQPQPLFSRCASIQLGMVGGLHLWHHIDIEKKSSDSICIDVHIVGWQQPIYFNVYLVCLVGWLVACLVACLFVCLFANLFVNLSVCQSVCQSVYRSDLCVYHCLSMDPSICRAIGLSDLSIDPSTHQSIDPLTYLM